MTARILLYPVALVFAIIRLLTYGKRKEEKTARRKGVDTARKRGHDPLEYTGQREKSRIVP
jgi:hypothetical protein